LFATLSDASNCEEAPLLSALLLQQQVRLRLGAAARRRRGAPRPPEGQSTSLAAPPLGAETGAPRRWLSAALQIVAAASTIEKTLRETLPNRTDVAAAAKIGELLAERARPVLGEQQVGFSKPRGKPYHGKMKALVDAVRAGGVKV
jgi:hypothetical protein